MKTTIILQARSGSSRLPKKSLLPLGPSNIFELIIRRSINAKVDDFWVATTELIQDNVFENYARKFGVNCFRGSNEDVFSRFLSIIEKTKSDRIIRLTADNPLTGADSINYLVDVFDRFPKREICYLSDFSFHNFPIGSFGEIFYAENLLNSAQNLQPYHLSHVTLKLRETLKNEIPIPCSAEFPYVKGWRWTVDHLEDFQWFFNFYVSVGEQIINWKYADIVHYLRMNPQLIWLDSEKYKKDIKLG